MSDSSILLATVPSPSADRYRSTVLPALDRLATTTAGAFDSFARTWSPHSGAEVVQVVLRRGPGDTAGLERTVRDALGDLPVEFTTPADAVAPSPLWNAAVGGPAFDHTSRRLYRAAAPLMLDLVRSRPDGFDDRSADETAVRLMVAHARATLHGSPWTMLADGDLLPLRLVSYRSHYEAVYARAAHPEAFEAACERAYEALGPAARAAVAASGTPDPDERTGTVSGWADLIRSEHATLAAAFGRGELTDTGKRLEDLERELGRRLDRTRFHEDMTPAMRALMYDDDDFLAFRLETSLLYSVLFTLGHSLPERYVLCYVVARANEDVSGRSAAQLRNDLGALAERLTGIPEAVTP